jgi:Mrp family chromosome partitioning ATPase
LAAVVGLVAGATAGWLSAQPIYQAKTVLTVTPGLADDSAGLVATPSEPGGTRPGNLERLAALCTTRVLLENAACDPAWGAATGDGGAATVDLLREGLQVDAEPGTQPGTGQIILRFTASRPKIAIAATGAVARAQAALCAATADDARKAVERTLAHQQAELDQLTALADQQTRLRKQFAGPFPIEQQLAAKRDELSKVSAQLRDLGTARTVATTMPAIPRTGEVDRGTLLRLTAYDPQLGLLLARRDDLERSLDSTLMRVGPGAPEAIATRMDLDLTRAAIAGRVDAARIASAGGGIVLVDNKYLSIEELEKRAQLWRVKAGELTAQAAELVKATEELAALDDTATQVRAELAATRAALPDALRRRAAIPRIAITEPGHEPQRPIIDRRPVWAGVGGAIGCVGLALLTLLCFAADQRLRRPDAAILARAGAPLLGTVPVVKTGPDQQPQATDLTALSIHEIRALLEIRAKAADARSFAITSPSPGSGKTSLTVGLAASLALSGTKTLLVDCEMVSRVLDPQAASGDGGKNQSLDEVMRQMGYLGGEEAELLLVTDEAQIGLTGTLEGRPLAECVLETSITGLTILPMLRPTPQHVGLLSCRFIAGLIAAAKQHYDMILFDTGPIPGSVETLCVAAEVDGVVIVASSGELQSRFDRTLSHLRMVNAKVAGTVFNRAADADLSLHAARGGPAFAKSGAGQSAAAGAARRLGRGAPGFGSGILAAAVYGKPKTLAAPGTPATPSASAPNARTAPEDSPEMEAVFDEDPQGDDVSAADAGAVADVLKEVARGPGAGAAAAAQPRRRDDVDALIDKAVDRQVKDAGADDLDEALDELVQEAAQQKRPTDSET